MPQVSRSVLRLTPLDGRLTPVVSAFEIASVAPPDAGLTGVVSFGTDPNDPFCTGVMTTDGRYVLTAAHCVDDDGDGQADADTYFVRFDGLPNGVEVLSVPKSDVFVKSGWKGGKRIGEGNDLAILRLPVLAPGGRTIGFELNTARDEIGRPLTFIGYGRIGDGSLGELSTGDAANPKIQYTPDIQRLRIDGTGDVTLSFNGNSVSLTGPVKAADVQKALLTFPGVFEVTTADVNSQGNPNNGAIEVAFTVIDSRVFGGYDVPQIELTPGDGYVGTVSVETLVDGNRDVVKRIGNAIISRYDETGQIGAGFPSEAGASVLGGGDSGGPAFIGEKVAGIASYGQGDSKFGDPTYWARVSDFLDSFINPILNARGPVVLDMSTQPVGADGTPDTVRVFAENYRLVIEVDGIRYFEAPLGRISGITVRGGSADALTINADGNFGVPVTLDAPGATTTRTAYPWVAVGPVAGSPLVRLVDTSNGTTAASFLAYEVSFTGGVTVATADLTGDGVPDVVTGPRSGGGPVVKVYDGKTRELIRSFAAFESNFRGGVSVAVGDVTGDGVPDIVTAAGKGGGPVVKVFDGKTGTEVWSFYAFEPTFTGGVSLAVGDIDGDGVADIVAAAGQGGGPHVVAFSGATREMIRSFFAMDPKFTGGVSVAVADLSADSPGAGTIFVAAGTGGGPRVQGLSGPDATEAQSFFAADPGFVGGLAVAVVPDGDGGRVLVTAPATTAGTVRAYPVSAAGLADPTNATDLLSEMMGVLVG